MRAFMLGWEFPPLISGGLGTACYGLTKAMSRSGVEIVFVLPRAKSVGEASHAKILSAQGRIVTREVRELKDVTFHEVASPLRPYIGSGSYGGRSGHFGRGEERARYVRSWHCDPSEQLENYPGDLYDQVRQYACKVAEIATVEDFDIIHSHDWMTYPAGIAAAKVTAKPLIVHVHSTEFDRSGEHVNQRIYDIEREGMHAANRVVAVSNYTRNVVTRHYGIVPDKVEVVYNAVEYDGESNGEPEQVLPERTDKIVLFLGRITMQKGPEYFLAAAKKVLEKFDGVKFVMAGAGDMMCRIVELAAQMGIGHRVLFTGFLRGTDVEKMFQMADLFVMPSVSEPFGIAALEALSHRVPVLVSKQSGIAEVLTHALKVDFWDIDQMANKITAVLKYPSLRTVLCDGGHAEARTFRWENAAGKIRGIYERVLTGG